jgi:hypothetical protein
MATTKRSGAAKRSSNAKPAKKRAPAKRKATTRSTSNRSRSTSSPSSNSSSNGVPDTIKQVANTAKRPAVAVGAAAAGLAGGLVLRSRTRRKTVLGVKVPNSIGKTLSGIDPKSVAKTVGQASKRFAKTTKGVSKDLERAGDQAERIGKILD